MEFGHHPDPGTDFVLEVEAIEGELTDRAAGLPATMEIAARIERAMKFRVGGDCAAVAAKHDLRIFELAFKAGASIGVETVDGGQQREVTAREIYEGWRDQKGWVPWVEGGNSLMQDKARREAALGVNPTDGGKHD